MSGKLPVPISRRVVAAGGRPVLHYLDDGRDGRREVACSLAAAAAAEWETRPPIITPHLARHHRGNAGLYYAASLRAHVQFPTWLARDEAMALDFDRSVHRFAASPFRLSWPGSGLRTHVPTFCVRRVDGTMQVLDCIVDAGTPVQPRRAHAVRTARPPAGVGVNLLELQQTYAEVGWDYRVVSGHDPVWMRNLQWLAGYRHPRHDVPTIAARLLARFAARAALMPGVAEVGDPIAVLPVFYHLLWRQRLSVDLSVVLDGSTVVGPAEPLPTGPSAPLPVGRGESPRREAEES